MLERRFHPNPEESHSIDELRTHLAERYSIPTFELNPMLEPLLEIENYVNTNLQVSEDRLRFFFAVRAEGPVSLALFLYHMSAPRPLQRSGRSGPAESAHAFAQQDFCH